MSTAISTNVSSPPRIHPTSMGELNQLAELFAKTGIAPPAFRGKPADTMLALLYGNAIGLSAPQSLLGVQVINGRPSLTADSMLAICRSSPVFEDLVETFEHAGTDRCTAVCIAKRRGCSPVASRYGVADAKRAGLWGRGVWAAYPERMLRIRARTFALRDLFGDLLQGFTSAEEAADIPTTPDEPPVVTFEPVPVAESVDAPQPVAEAAAAAIEAATTPTALEAMRARVEMRVLEGKLGAAEATELVQKIAAKLTTITKGDHDNG